MPGGMGEAGVYVNVKVEANAIKEKRTGARPVDSGQNVRPIAHIDLWTHVIVRGDIISTDSKDQSRAMTTHARRSRHGALLHQAASHPTVLICPGDRMESG